MSRWWVTIHKRGGGSFALFVKASTAEVAAAVARSHQYAPTPQLVLRIEAKLAIGDRHD